MAAPTVTKVANAILFEGDQSFTLVLNNVGLKKARFYGIEWYLDPDYKYPLADSTVTFPNNHGYPCIFYAKGTGIGPLTGSIFLDEVSPFRNDSWLEDWHIGTTVVTL